MLKYKKCNILIFKKKMGKFDNLSPLKKWVISNKYFIKTTETRDKKAEATHYLLDGGIWKIPLSEYQNFLKLLASDLSAGEKHYISENKTEIFKFICDLDFYDETVITTTQVKHIVTVIQKIVNEYLGEQRIIICGADSKNVIINEINFIKSGFHLVFPKLWISVETSKKLRILIINKLIETFNERLDYNKWEDVVDLSIYEDNGLRMVGCRKIGFCKTCKNKKETRDQCEPCGGVGKIDENRVYKPVAVIPDNQEYLESITRDYYTMLLETSIYNYANLDATCFVKPINIELPEQAKKGKKGTTKKTVSINENGAIETFIRKNFKEHYSKCCVKKVSKNQNMQNETTYYVEIDDNFCMNVNRNHTSSNIYFQIGPSGISQRCYCRKETTQGRCQGVCREYCSKEIALTKTLKKLLFGEELGKKTKNVKKLVNYNITKSDNRENCLSNCKNLLLQLKNEIV